MRRPSFKAAIEWLAHNDDNYWLDDEEPALPVTAALVADLFGVDDERVIKALRRATGREAGR